MKRLTIIIAFALLSIVYISSCSKDDDVSQNKNNTTTMNNARLNNEMTNEEMEADINAFIDKLDEPNSYPGMNFEEAFEYVEATLNYKYVNYDYSKCANTQEFSGSVSITLDSDNEMSMTEISEAYNTILADWQSNYYSVEDTVKTPIVFDITDVTNSTIKYTMIVGYGELDLEEWGEEFVPQAVTDYIVASSEYHYYLLSYLNDIMQYNHQPFGKRVYIPAVGSVQYLAPKLFPSGGSDIYPGIQGYTDYLKFYSDNVYSNFHTNLFQLEYNFHRDNLYPIMYDYIINNTNSDYVSLAFVPYYNLLNSSNLPYKIWHGLIFWHGTSFYTSEALWQL